MRTTPFYFFVSSSAFTMKCIAQREDCENLKLAT